MKSLLLLLLFCVLASGCSVANFLTEEDCGYSAYYTKPKGGEDVEIIFSRVLAEVVEDGRHCGFAYMPTNVTKALVNGKDMREVKRGDATLYIAPPGFDPERDDVQIKILETTYSRRLESIRRQDDRVYFSLKR
jgi:hypothetical protein